MKKKLASIFSKFEIEFGKKTILEMQFDVTLKNKVCIKLTEVLVTYS